MDTIDLISAHRTGSANQAARSWFDFVINGERLSRTLEVGDKIGVFGWLSARQQREYADQLLLRSHSELSSGRVPIFVCPECSDLGCGAVTVDVFRDGTEIVWDDFHIETNFGTATRIEAPQFVFDAEAYRLKIWPQRGV
ncbi:MAG: hypothetical protein ACO1OB_01555 [Archangium sp.]